MNPEATPQLSHQRNCVLALICTLPVNWRSCGQEATSAELGSQHFIYSSRMMPHVQSSSLFHSVQIHVLKVNVTMEQTSCPEPYLEGIVVKAVFSLPASVIHRKAFQKEFGIGVE